MATENPYDGRESLDELVRELHRIVHPGLEREAAALKVLPSLRAVQARQRSSSRAAMIHAAREALEEGIRMVGDIDPLVAEALDMLLVLGPKPRDSTARRRADVGEMFGIDGETVRRHRQEDWLRHLALQLVTLSDSVRDETGEHGPPSEVTWATIESTLRRMHREIEGQFEPHAVLAMSGPGSFAACYCMSMNPRDVPVVVANTFPRRGHMGEAQQRFDEASADRLMARYETTKWNVYIPDVVARYGPGSRWLIFDDRVVGGRTQGRARDDLEGLGYEVMSAALVVTPESKGLVDFYGMVVEGDFTLPWGSKRGRT